MFMGFIPNLGADLIYYSIVDKFLFEVAWSLEYLFKFIYFEIQVFDISKLSQIETYPIPKLYCWFKTFMAETFFYLSSLSSQNIKYNIEKYSIKKIASYIYTQKCVLKWLRDIVWAKHCDLSLDRHLNFLCYLSFLETIIKKDRHFNTFVFLNGLMTNRFLL